MDTTIPDAITFLERQGWAPRRARRAWAEFEAEPTEAKRLEAVRCLDAVLIGFQRLAALVVAEIRESEDTPRRAIRIGELEDLREAAGRLVSNHRRSAA